MQSCCEQLVVRMVLTNIKWLTQTQAINFINFCVLCAINYVLYFLQIFLGFILTRFNLRKCTWYDMV